MDKATEYAEIFATFALDETVVSANPGETIRLPASPGHSLDSLPALNLAEESDVRGAELRIGKTLGEGGMGVIRSAIQSPFERSVALKTLRADRPRDDATAFALLREAIAAGRLEHPNVIPIYAVGRDSAGLPVIVMKRIDGGSWADLLADPSRVPDDDPLEWHLRVFIQICAAVEFAHHNGIVHRDLKPDNVMVGAHDDVYLVDWGLAVMLEPDPSGRLPCVADVSQIAGTPAYMAPEMAAGGGHPIDARADVYCLGAVLHELVTGTLRHQGQTVFQMMLNAYQSEPIVYADSVPPDLASICNKATAHEPEDRFQSATELRAAVRGFLEHRSAAALTREAQSQLDSLAESLADESTDPEARRVSVYRFYGAARFGFERSLADWSDQPAARDGLQRTLELMIDWELHHGSTHAASALLAELPTARPDLDERLRAVEASRAHEREELQALRGERRDRDIKVGAKGRAVQVLVLILGALLLPAAVAALGPWDPVESRLGFWLISAAAGLWVVINFAVGWWAPFEIAAIEKTRLNWQVGWSVVIVCAWLIVSRGVAMALGVPIPTQLVLEILGFAAFAAVLAVIFDARIYLGAAAFVAGAIAVYAFPTYALELFVLFDALGLLAIAFAWRHMSLATKSNLETVDTADPNN